MNGVFNKKGKLSFKTAYHGAYTRKLWRDRMSKIVIKLSAKKD